MTANEYAQMVASSGYRPPRLAVFGDDLHNLIQACWRHDPLERPDMAAVKAGLQELLQAEAASGGRSSGKMAQAGRLGAKGSGPEHSCGCAIS